MFPMTETYFVTPGDAMGTRIDDEIGKTPASPKPVDPHRASDERSSMTVATPEIQLDRNSGARFSTGNPGRPTGSQPLFSKAIPTEGGLGFEALSVSQRNLLLLADLTMTVPAGSTMAIMGRSGVGKTSLLRVIAGLAEPMSGRVLRPAGRVPIVFQEPRLLPWRTTRQNVELVLPKAERRNAIEWLGRVGLADAVDKYPLTLSGGMRQRVSIARALACESPLVLVDEPFSHLDVVTADQLRTELKRHLAETGRTCIWVTHDPAEAATVAQTTLVMNGPPEGGWQLVPHARYANPEQLIVALATTLEQSGIRS